MSLFQINPDRMYARPTQKNILAELAVADLTDEALIEKLSACCITEEQKKAINENIKKHISDTFTHKNELKRQLTAIASVLSSKTNMEKYNISEDTQAVLIDKLIEGIDACTPGFMDRAQEIILAFNTPRSIEEILASYRMTLVEDAYNKDELRESTKREVHTHNRFYVIANTLGYSVPCVQNDPYPGNKDDSDIEKAIRDEFKKFYTPLHISNKILKSTLHSLLDTKNPDEKIIAFDRASEFLKQILKNNKLNYYDFFAYDNESYELKGIDWIKINSLLIKFLHSEGYFVSSKNDKSIKISIDEAHKLTLMYDKNDLSNATLECQIDGHHYIGYLFSDTNFFNIFSEEEKKRYLKHIKDIFLKNILELGYLKNADYFFSLINKMQPLLENEIAQILRDMIFEDTKNQTHVLIKYTKIFPHMSFFSKKDKLKAENLHLILHFFNSKQCQYIIDDKNINITSIINSIKNFKTIMSNLEPKKRDIVFEKINNQIPTIIKSKENSTAKNFGIVMSLCATEKCRSIMRDARFDPALMIQSAKDFSEIMEQLHLNQKNVFFDSAKNHIVSLLKSNPKAINYKLVLKFCTPSQRDFIIDDPEFDTSLIIRSPKDCADIMKYLDLTQRNKIFKKIQDLCPLIKSSTDYIKIMDTLNPEQRENLFDKIKDKIPYLIEFDSYLAKEKSIISIINSCASKKLDTLINLIENNLPSIAPSRKELIINLNQLIDERRSISFDKLTNHIATKLIKSENHFIEIVKSLNLSNDQRLKLLNAIKNDSLKNKIRLHDNDLITQTNHTPSTKMNRLTR